MAICEEGGWGPYNPVNGTGYQHGPTYFGSLGISSGAWDTYGAGIDRNNATPDQQITVASRIQPYPPDQYGVCRGW